MFLVFSPEVTGLNIKKGATTMNITDLLKQAVKIHVHDITRIAIKQNVFAVSVTEPKCRSISASHMIGSTKGQTLG